MSLCVNGLALCVWMDQGMTSAVLGLVYFFVWTIWKINEFNSHSFFFFTISSLQYLIDLFISLETLGNHPFMKFDLRDNSKKNAYHIIVEELS